MPKIFFQVDLVEIRGAEEFKDEDEAGNRRNDSHLALAVLKEPQLRTRRWQR